MITSGSDRDTRASARGRGHHLESERQMGGIEMETVTVVLNVLEEQVEAFEAGFREHEYAVWQDLQDRGLLIAATLNRLDISSRPVEGAVQYLVAAIFATGEGHHAHDAHPGFEAWNKIADAFQTGQPLAFGGETVVRIGIGEG
jgi:hypothetical protein